MDSPLKELLVEKEPCMNIFPVENILVLSFKWCNYYLYLEYVTPSQIMEEVRCGRFLKCLSTQVKSLIKTEMDAKPSSSSRSGVSHCAHYIEG